jgi:hypothetical protein
MEALLHTAGRKITMAMQMISELPARTFRGSVTTLRAFEGVGCLWRVGAAIATYVVVRAVPIAAAIVIAVTAVDGRVLQATVSATIAIAFDEVAKGMRARLPWEGLVVTRLATWEAPNPPTHVSILVGEADVDRAKRALREAGFNPGVFMTSIASPPPDAPELGIKVSVEEPEAHPQSSSDENREQRMADALDAVGVRARISMIDVPRRAAA